VNTADADLLALQQGDDEALSRLIARWKKPLFCFAWSYLHNAADANDLVAEVFVRLYRQRSRLDPGSNLSGWLFTILTNLCHSHHRWRRRHPAVSLDAPRHPGRPEQSLADIVPAGSEDPAHSLEHQEALTALAAAIEALPHDLKAPLLLHQYERMDYAAIGAIVGCSVRGVETRLYRARQFLRAELTRPLREASRV
jgi:RNA polymerase sigma factor (sigma-70 family)